MAWYQNAEDCGTCFETLWKHDLHMSVCEITFSIYVHWLVKSPPSSLQRHDLLFSGFVMVFTLPHLRGANHACIWDMIIGLIHHKHEKDCISWVCVRLCLDLQKLECRHIMVEIRTFVILICLLAEFHVANDAGWMEWWSFCLFNAWNWVLICHSDFHGLMSWSLPSIVKISFCHLVSTI